MNKETEFTHLTKRQKEVGTRFVKNAFLNEEKLSLPELLTQCGVSEDEFINWIMESEFSSYVSRLAIDFSHVDELLVWSRLMELIASGNVQAIKLFFDILHKNQGKTSANAGPSNEIADLRSELFGEEGDERQSNTT